VSVQVSKVGQSSLTTTPLAAASAATLDQRARRGRSRRRTVAVVSALVLAATCVLMIFPFLWAALSSTKPTDVAFANPPVFRYSPTLQPYVDLWQTTNFYLYLINTLVVAVISTVVALLVGLPCAYALSRYGGAASLVLLVLALVFRALPRFAVVLPMYEISKSVGLYDTRWALAAALIAINQPFTIWLLRNFFAEIPRELDEAAMVDGCTRIGMLRRIMVPLMGPGILTAGIFVFLFAFQEYLTAAVLTDVSAKTVPVFIATQIGQNLPLLQQASAATVLLTLPVVGIAFVAQKYLVAGLASGAVKG
jgi:multiple sugar transport system permease protein